MLKRADREVSALYTLLFAPLLEDEIIASGAHRFRAFLKTVIGAFFDYMVEHPRVMRMIIWEHAEGWQTYAKIASQLETEDLEQFEALFSKAQRAGLLRSDLDVVVVFLLVEQICWSYPTALPFYQLFLPGRDFSSAAALALAREQIIEFIVAGMMVNPPETKETKP